MVEDGGVGPEGVEEDVEARGVVDCGGEGGRGGGVLGVDEAEGGFQGTGSDAGFDFFGDEIADGWVSGLERMMMWWDGKTNKMAVPVVSEAVPAVVGMQISGLRGLVIGKPFPSGAFTYKSITLPLAIKSH